MQMEQVITLNVKGNVAQAVAAARAHGFEGVQVIRTATEMARHFDGEAPQVLLTVRATRATQALAATWFTEPEVVTPGYGYAPGSLLYYSQAHDPSPKGWAVAGG